VFIILVVISSKSHFFIYQKSVINKKYKSFDDVVKRAFICLILPILGFGCRTLESDKNIPDVLKKSFVEC